MSLLKNIILLVVFASLIYFGGAGTQSDSTSLQGMGFVSVVIGLIVLYILFKIFWSAMSMSMALIVIAPMNLLLNMRRLSNKMDKWLI